MTQNERRRSMARRRAASTRAVRSFVAMALVVAAIVLAIIGIIRFTSKPNGFLHGVYVNGISMGGYSYEEGYRLVNEMADQRLNQNAITLTYGDKIWTLTPSMLGASMDVNSQLALAWNFGHTGNFFQRKAQSDYLKDQTVVFNSELQYDEAALDEFVARIKSEIDVAPVNATVTVEKDEKLTVSQSSDGKTLDGAALKEALIQVIVEGSTPQIELVSQVVKPTISTEDMISGTQKIAECTTSTKASSSNRTHNIKRALGKFNGFVVHPGETVSFNKIVGKRTLENKFKEAPEFAGTNVQMGIGGGVCQASTTLYNALLRAGMTVEERWQHTMTVNYIHPSLDSTVSDSGKDLVFTNNRDSAIFIYTNVDSERAQVKIYGQPTEYKIVLESETTQENIVSKGYKTKKDTTGKYAYYTDEKVVYSEGKPGLKSRAFICYYKKDTGELVERSELHADYYAPSAPIYWVGIHERDEEIIP